MKNKHLFWPILVVLTGLPGFFSCNKKDSTTPSAGLPADKTVTASVQGRVLDQNGVPVKDATVTSGTATTTTDVNGSFAFSQISMSSRWGFIKVVKDGYFTGSRSIIIDEGGSASVSINLLLRTSVGSFSSSGGGSITVKDANTVAFAANSVVTASTNAAYSGTVHVYAAYLDPGDPGLAREMPGDLRGIGSDGKETAIQTFGMMVVELEGDGGEKLQIASGSRATITMTIPGWLEGKAPASIPLWYFNDTTGKWIQQGAATRNGNSFTGQVAHFSFWNCDIPLGVVNFSAHFKDQHGNVLAFTPIQIVSHTYGPRDGMTDANGLAQGLVPEGDSLQLEVLNPCGTVIFNKSYGPLTTDTDWGTLSVTVPGALLTLTGTVVDCSSSPVSSGYVSVQLDGQTYRSAVTNGAFTLTLSRCNGTAAQAQLTAGDYTTLQEGTATTLTVDSGQVQTGQLSACGTSFDQYIILNFNGKTYNITEPPDTISLYNSSGEVIIYGLTPPGVTPVESLNLAVANMNAAGSYSTDWFFFTSGSNNYTQQSNAGVQVVVSHFGTGGDYVQGTFNGMIKDTGTNVINSYPLTGSFRIKN